MSLFNNIQHNREEKKKEQQRKVEEACVEVAALKDELEGRVSNKIRMLKKTLAARPNDRAAKEREVKNLRGLLSQYWYVESMLNQLLDVRDRIVLMEDLKLYGDAMKEAAKLIKGLNGNVPDIRGIVKDIQKVLKPLKDELPDLGDVSNILNMSMSPDESVSMDSFINQVLEGADWTVQPTADILVDSAPDEATRQSVQEELSRMMGTYGVE